MGPAPLWPGSAPAGAPLRLVRTWPAPGFLVAPLSLQTCALQPLVWAHFVGSF
jgi:hypothetical protein